MIAYVLCNGSSRDTYSIEYGINHTHFFWYCMYVHVVKYFAVGTRSLNFDLMMIAKWTSSSGIKSHGLDF